MVHSPNFMVYSGFGCHLGTWRSKQAVRPDAGWQQPTCTGWPELSCPKLGVLLVRDYALALLQCPETCDEKHVFW